MCKRFRKYTIFNKLSVIFFFFLILSTGCKNNSDFDENSIQIISPKTDRTFYEDEFVVFTTNIDSENIKWYSSKDGFLGENNNLNVFLSSGKHEITCLIENYIKQISIEVEPHLYSKGDVINYCVSSNSEVFLYKGKYQPVICCLDDGKTDLHITNCCTNQQINKDIIIKNDVQSKSLITAKLRNASNRQYSVGQKRDFFIIKTTNQLDEPYKRSFECKKTGEHYTAWVCEEDTYDSVFLQQCLQNFEKIIYPRVTRIWGDGADVDGDNKIALIFSSTINEEKNAIGFFNSNDLFSEENNPYSNKIDSLYMGLPTDENETSYSVNSITATIAHELTHAVNFNQKTYSKVLSGIEKPPVEEVYLDEAFSHLSESLCGFGESGGNVKFVEYYLKKTSDYSYCKQSRLGEDDCVGRRGAMSMFLSWLFWQKGGMEWNVENPILINDLGGITYLRKLASSEESGWENIGRIFGKDIVSLFVEYSSQINNQQYKGVINPKSDPYTLECVSLFCCMPCFAEKHINPSGDVFSPMDYIPWSISLKDNFEVEKDGVYKILDNSNGTFFLNLVKVE